MSVTQLVQNCAETVRQIVTEVEERLAILLGVPLPTPGERVLEGRRLSVIGQVGKCHHAPT